MKLIVDSADLVRQYLSAQANGQILFVRQAGEFLDRGLTLQRERDDNLNNYRQLEEALPGGVPLQAWIVENKLLAGSASFYLHNVPFVTQ
jgi:hypothetical protein